MRIGIAGFGKMGSAMAARLVQTGADVIVWNRTGGRAEASGLPVAESPRALAGQCDVVMSTLFDAEAVEAVYHEPQGLLEAASGRLFIEMSTVRPGTQVALAASVRAAGGAFLECPVGGTTGPALAGKLLGLVGGETAELERARPVLDALCRRVEHVGPVGAGAAMQLAISLPLPVFYQALGESMALVRQFRLQPAWLMEFFAETAGGTNVLEGLGPAIAATLSGAEAGVPAFDIGAIRKDLQTMVAEAQSRGFTRPAAVPTVAVYDGGDADGRGKRDGAWRPAYWPHKVVPG